MFFHFLSDFIIFYDLERNNYCEKDIKQIFQNKLIDLYLNQITYINTQ